MATYEIQGSDADALRAEAMAIVGRARRSDHVEIDHRHDHGVYTLVVVVTRAKCPPCSRACEQGRDCPARLRSA